MVVNGEIAQAVNFLRHIYVALIAFLEILTGLQPRLLSEFVILEENNPTIDHA